MIKLFYQTFFLNSSAKDIYKAIFFKKKNKVELYGPNNQIACAVTGIQQYVMSFEPGVELEEDAQWQAPAYCFTDDDNDDEEEGKRNDNAARGSGEEAGDGLEVASRLLRKLAGAAATS